MKPASLVPDMSGLSVPDVSGLSVPDVSGASVSGTSGDSLPESDAVCVSEEVPSFVVTRRLRMS